MVDRPDGLHPLDGTLRFVLELSALGAWCGGIAAAVGGGALGWTAGVIVGVAAAAAWGTFAVPHDPSRGGTPGVVVDGRVRFLLEWVILLAPFGLLGAGWWTGLQVAGALVHAVVGWPRHRWLLAQRSGSR